MDRFLLRQIAAGHELVELVTLAPGHRQLPREGAGALSVTTLVGAPPLGDGEEVRSETPARLVRRPGLPQREKNVLRHVVGDAPAHPTAISTQGSAVPSH